MATKIKSFSKKEAILFGWEITKKNFWFFVSVLLVTYGIQFLPNFISGYTDEQGAIPLFISIIVYVASLGISLGFIKILLSFVDKGKPQFSDLFSLFKSRLLWKYFLASIVYGFIMLLGALPSILFLVVSGLLEKNTSSIYSSISFMLACASVLIIAYISIRGSFFPYLILDKGDPIFKSFASSWRMTKGKVWELFLFNFLLGLIIIAGILALGVGLFVAMPVSSLASAYVYRQLSNSKRIK